MKKSILIITQKVDKNDPVLGFFHTWILEFSKKLEKVNVICLEKGEYNLPENVKVFSLGKEEGVNRLKYLYRFYKYIWQERNNYDSVFVHMNPEYVLLGGLFWRFLGKRIYLWYTHKAVNLKLKIATFFVHTILSASKESFRLKTDKLKIVGHGIDLNVFYPADIFPQEVHIISVGRISPTKNYEPFLEAIYLLAQETKKPFKVSIVGGPVSISDGIYLKKLHNYCKSKKIEHIISFVGPISYREVSNFYRKGTIFVNLSNTGSLDKAVLEAMACGLSVVTSNEAFQNLIDSKYITTNNPETIKNIIKSFFNIVCDAQAVSYVKNNHSLRSLIQNINDNFIDPKKVCFFGIYNPNYSRNRVLLRGFKENHYTVIECCVDPKKYPGWRKFLQLYKQWKQIKHNNFSLCIVGFPGHSVVWFAIILFGRNKVIFDFFVSLFNSNIEDRKQYHKLSFNSIHMWFLDYFSLTISRFILIDTHAHRDFISQKFYINKQKFKVVYVGSDDLVVFPKPKIINEIKTIVHFHGTNTPLQGFIFIKEAAKILESYKDIEFHIYGFSGEETSNLKFFPRFEYKNISDILSKADIVLGIFGTTKKADIVVPNKVFEGIAAQKPVITVKSKAILEIFSENLPVLLCKKGSALDLADKILFLKNNQKERTVLSERAFDFFKHNLTPKILINKFIKIF